MAKAKDIDIQVGGTYYYYHEDRYDRDAIQYRRTTVSKEDHNYYYSDAGAINKRSKRLKRRRESKTDEVYTKEEALQLTWVEDYRYVIQRSLDGVISYDKLRQIADIMGIQAPFREWKGSE